MKTPKVKAIQSLARGLEVLQLLQVSHALTLRDLHRLTGIPKASLLRILRTLMERGMVWQRMLDKAYMPSVTLADLAARMDSEQALVEVASPILEALSQSIAWPSVLAVPRLSHMEVLETNASRTYFDNIPLGPLGFRVNMLRSASGRAYLAACDPALREGILESLRRSGHVGDRHAHDPAYVQRLLEESQSQGFALRDPDFGGHFDLGRDQVDDGRESLGVAIQLEHFVPGAINITWAKRALSRDQALALFAEPAKQAARDIAAALAQRGRPREPDNVSLGET